MVAPCKIHNPDPPPRLRVRLRPPAGLVRFAGGVGSLALAAVIAGVFFGAIAAIAWHVFHWLT